ncbi:hypothetical protein [Aliikangiella coralliicola]|uniref:HPr kinase/phosphorylase C-terminal domain-containing protein n=1 Tax=Aliikangiella coralliicola TaxID=2592383 RepID=A0A545UJ58_9GAMM|nr:hypothetical protein [Aliikangiella coralliicola]TQV89502.1 hypothetical protein FLL46_01060 [Aliikangiella coralliicola]
MNYSSVRTVLGVPIHFSCESRSIHSIISQIFPLEHKEVVSANYQISINHSLVDSKSLDFPALFELNEHKLVGQSGNNCFKADRLNNIGEAFVCQRMLNNEYVLRHQVLNTLCYFLLTHHHFLPVHAASFRLNQLLVLCIGSSGAGKSTLAMAAKHRNLVVLAEDICFVGVSKSVGLRADCREFHLFPDSYRLFNNDINAQAVMTHNGKLKHIIANDSKQFSTGKANGSASELIVVFINSDRSQKSAKFEPISTNSYFNDLLYPKEEGFELFSNARLPAVQWLKKSPCFSANIAGDFNQFFDSIEKVHDELICVTQ